MDYNFKHKTIEDIPEDTLDELDTADVAGVIADVEKRLRKLK